jgi:hypothetical protein
MAGRQIAALLQAFGRSVGLWELSNVLQYGLAISKCSFYFLSFFKSTENNHRRIFLRLVAN